MKLKIVPIVIVSLVILLNIITLLPRYNTLSHTTGNAIVKNPVVSLGKNTKVTKVTKVIPKVTIVPKYTKRCLELRAYVHSYGISSLKEQYAASNVKLTPLQLKAVKDCLK